MIKQQTMSPMVCLNVASGSMSACDGLGEVDDPSVTGPQARESTHEKKVAAA